MEAIRRGVLFISIFLPMRIFQKTMLYDCRFKRLDGQEVFLMDMKEKITELADGFSSCSKMLIAIGDETRQHLILEIMKMGNCSGVRVGEITEKKFYFELLPSGSVKLTNGKGFYTKLDLGIVKYHFEAVSKAAIL